MEKFKATYIGTGPKGIFGNFKTNCFDVILINGQEYTFIVKDDFNFLLEDTRTTIPIEFIFKNFDEIKKIKTDDNLNNITCELNCNHNKDGKCSFVNPKIQVGTEKFTCNSLEPTWSQEIECMYMAGFWINKEYKFCPYCKLKHE